MAFIKINDECFSNGKRLQAGLFYELPADEARQLITLGRASQATEEEVLEAAANAEAEAAAEAKAAEEAAAKAAAEADAKGKGK